jgi:hypothetical protein
MTSEIPARLHKQLVDRYSGLRGKVDLHLRISFERDLLLYGTEPGRCYPSPFDPSDDHNQRLLAEAVRQGLRVGMCASVKRQSLDFLFGER